VLLLLLLGGLPLAAACGGEEMGSGEITSPASTADDGAGGDSGDGGGGADDGEDGDSGDGGGGVPASEPPSEDTLGDPSGDPPYGADDDHIWGPDCEVFVSDLLETHQYAELRSELACILNDPDAPAEVRAKARDADALAQEGLTEGDNAG
jgi:hypothetical protein